jgi:hypothetical protein
LMAKDGLVRLPRIDESLRDEFKQDVKERFNGTKGHYRTEVERALRAYLEGSKGGDIEDRLRRLENTVEDIHDHTAPASDGGDPKTKKDSNVSEVGPRRRKKLDAIESQIDREAGDATKVHESVVNKAIEDNAGSSGPTLRRYKQMLKQRRIAFANPSEHASTWFVDEDVFVQVVESNFSHRNDDIAKEYGEAWYQSKVDDLLDDEDGPKGFQ